MRIAVLADQHGDLPPIPPCDLMILSGDLTGGNPTGVRDGSDDYWRLWLETHFVKWTRGAPYTIAMAGNHDTVLERYDIPNSKTFCYLRDSGCEFGGLKFWGAPWIRKLDSLAFNLIDTEIEKRFALVSNDTDVVVCHMPPFGLCDAGHGSVVISGRIRQIRPKLVTCGHIHEGHGECGFYGTKVVNAACKFR